MPTRRRSKARGGIAALAMFAMIIGAFVTLSVVGFRPLGAHAADDPVACGIAVPAHPLTARGLATPYRLTGCQESDPGAAAFVQATILDPATGKLFNYAPLVVTDGDRPAAAPVVPKLPRNAVVGVWFGFNGDDLTLRGPGVRGADGRCVNGAAGSIFGQYAYCNAPAFFQAANRAIRAGKISVPALGTGSDGLPCPTTRDFGIVDQDQSDNVTTAYLVSDGRMAQANAANAAALPGAQKLTNASDNGLVDNRIDPALGCSPWTVPDLGNGMQPSNSLALDELQAAARQAAPAALVPLNDPMVLADGAMSRIKTDAYRAGVNMPSVGSDPGQSPAQYCRLMTSKGWDRVQRDKAALQGRPSPDATADSLYSFVGARLAGSYDALGCAQLLNAANPFTVTQQGGVAVGVVKGAVGAVTGGAATPTPTASATGAATPTPTASAPPMRHKKHPAAQPTPTPAPADTAAPAAPNPTPSASADPTPTPSG